MATTALEAVHEHLAALNSHETSEISKTITYPFVQGLPNGAKHLYGTESEYPPMSKGQPPLTLDSCAEIARSPDGKLAVFDVVVDQAPDGNPHHRRREALYCVVEIDGEWKTIWRQFLGYL